MLQCPFFIFVYKTEERNKDMRDFRASATNEKLKQEAQKQAVDALQCVSVLYKTQLKAIR